MSNALATITFTGGAVDNVSLQDGRYTMTAAASAFGGNSLDGAGNAFMFEFNYDGAVSAADFIQCRLRFGGSF